MIRTRNKDAAPTFMKKALKRHGLPAAIVTDGLKSYVAARRELGNGEKQQVGRHANNRVENSHLPFRQRERAMLRFRRMKTPQKFASVHADVHNHFNQERHLVSRQDYETRRSAAPCRVANPLCLALRRSEHQCVNLKPVRIGLTAPNIAFMLTSGYADCRFETSKWSTHVCKSPSVKPSYKPNSSISCEKFEFKFTARACKVPLAG